MRHLEYTNIHYFLKTEEKISNSLMVHPLPNGAPVNKHTAEQNREQTTHSVIGQHISRDM